MSKEEFVDYYELFQLSPNADTETIERIFRHLAKKYHPDNAESADAERFRKIVDGHNMLVDPEARAGYDVKYQEYWNRKWRLASEASDGTVYGNDHLARKSLLSLLYVQRRRNTHNPGMGNHEMARLINSPHELVEFHLWYLKAKGWVERLETGHMAITAEGVDQVERGRILLTPDHLLEEHIRSGEHAGEKDVVDINLLVEGKSERGRVKGEE
ncbi:MAG TPA: DnaJ domain-containing protein [Geobacteraceae bacterium]|nr:DnaJ domain-containing protein [Geobacteraceae bacterium]